MAKSLPAAISEELFGDSQTPDMAADFIADFIDGCGLTAGEPGFNNRVVIVPFSKPAINLVGKVTINRQSQTFSVEARKAGWSFLPATGGWTDATRYIKSIVLAIKRDNGTHRS